MIVTIGVISTNYSQSIYSQHQIDRIKAEQLAKGVAWYNYINRSFTGTTGYAPGDHEVIDGKTYNITITENLGTGPQGTDIYDIQIDY